MRCGHTGLLDTAVGSSLVVSGVFGVPVQDTSRVLLVGDECPQYNSQVLCPVSSGHQDSL